jgi:hypothetical protein
LLAWEKGLEGSEMTESQVANRWINLGEVKKARKALRELLQGRFPGSASEELGQVIQNQDSLPLLGDWFRATVQANTFEQFLAVLKG